MLTQILLVKEWQECFGRKGHIVSEIPIIVSDETAQARVDFITEELHLYFYANSQGDIVGVLDAIIDILYFTFGMVVVHGLQNVIRQGFSIVHMCNMSNKRPEKKLAELLDVA